MPHDARPVLDGERAFGHSVSHCFTVSSPSPLIVTDYRCDQIASINKRNNDSVLTPSVVLLVTDNTINPILNPSEVSYLFSMPLSSFLHSNPTFIPGWNYGLSSRSQPFLPSSSHGQRSALSGQTHQPAPPTQPKGYSTDWDNEPRRVGGVIQPDQTTERIEGEAFGAETRLTIPPPPTVAYAAGKGVVGGKGVYYQYRDVPWGVGTVRFHRFLTGKEEGGVKPVYGLTAWVRNSQDRY